MFHMQKETILRLLKCEEAKRNYDNKYWFSYKDFLDPTDKFTDFSCENLDGKQGYITLIENLLEEDESAKIFVEVYGFEEDEEESFIYADTLIIFSKLPLGGIEKIFHKPKDLFPNDIQKIDDFSQQTFIVDNNGDLISVENLSGNDYSVYYCWWD